MSEEMLAGKPDWIKTDIQWEEIVGLESVHRFFEGIKQTFQKIDSKGKENQTYAGDVWKKILNSKTPWELKLPA